MSKISKKRSKTAKKAARTRKRNSQKKQNKERGESAWENTITPSHEKYRKQLEKEFKNKLIRLPIGIPDFIIHSQNIRFEELKPNRFADGKLASAKGRFLNENQEKVVKELLKERVTDIFIVFYNQKQNKSFIYKRQKLTKKNYKEFCYSTPKEKRFDTDSLF
tara:strand:+ start:65 stop:553 length:489 start_codon:yes stop_codon:yes gene_type:complete